MDKIIEKLTTFQKLILSYTQDKENKLTQLSKSLNILQNQIDHYNYVKNTQPCQDFLNKFENVQSIVLEKINKRIENEMKEFVESRSQYISLFNELKSAIRNLISDLKIEATSLNENFTLSQEQLECLVSNQTIESKETDLSKGKSKRKSIPNSTGTADISEQKVMTLDGIFIITEILQDILVLENMNIVKLITLNNYEVITMFKMDEFRNSNEKFRSVNQLLKCFCESIPR